MFKEVNSLIARASVVVLSIAVVGTVLLLTTHAATPTANIEAENGTISGGSATKLTDSTASGGKAVKFSAATDGGTGGTSCPLPAYPNSSCTGVPAGTTFTNTVNGDYTASTDGQVIDEWHITGALVVTASNVVIKNSQIDGFVDNQDTLSSSFSITDSTVGPASGCVKSGDGGLEGQNITALRVYVRNHQDGLDMGGNNVSATDSFFIQCFLPGSQVGGDGFHSDGVQDYCGSTCSNLTLNHNTFDSRAGGNGNSALNLGSTADGSHLRTVSLSDNLFMGGSYTTALQQDGGSTWTVKDNRWVNGTWAYGPIDAEGTCANQSWSGNSIVTINSDYSIASTVSGTDCVN